MFLRPRGFRVFFDLGRPPILFFWSNGTSQAGKRANLRQLEQLSFVAGQRYIDRRYIACPSSTQSKKRCAKISRIWSGPCTARLDFFFELGRPKLIFLLVFPHAFSSLRRPPTCFVHLGSPRWDFLSTWDNFKTNNKVFDLVQTLSQVGNKNMLPMSPVANRATLMYSDAQSAARWYQRACPRALACDPRVCRQA